MTSGSYHRAGLRLYRLCLVWVIAGLICLVVEPSVVQSAPESSDGVGRSEQLEAVTLQLGWKHQFEFAGYYAAQAKGYYAEAGLNVTFLEGGPGKACYSIMMSGQAQYCADDGDNIFHFLKGTPLVALASIFQHSPVTLLSRKNSGLTTPYDLIGKRVETMHGGVPIPEILAMFKREGISLDQLQSKEDSFGVDRLINGDVDAIYVYVSNEPDLLEQIGIDYTLIRPRHYGIDFYGDTLFTSKQELEDHPERTKAFREASIRGWQYAMAHQEEIAKLIVEKYNSEFLLAHLLYEAATIENLMQSELVEIGHMNPGRWRHMADVMVDQGLVKPGYSLEGFIYDSNLKPDYTRMILFLAVGVTCSGFLIAFLISYNARLAKEVGERKKAEQELANAKEEAETASRLKGEFLAMMSHDICTPLNSILAMTDLLSETKKDFDPTTERRLTILQTSGQHLRDLIENILEFSRIETGVDEVEHAPFELEETVLGAVRSVEHNALVKGLAVNVLIDENLPKYFIGDSRRIRQVLINLTVNAIKFTNAGQVKIEVREGAGGKETLSFLVQDTGVGMSEDEIGTIFEAYRKGSGTGNALNEGFGLGYEGVGLGLTICHKLIEQMGGRIDVERLPEGGTRFYFELPLPEVIQDEAARMDAGPRPSLKKLSQVHLMKGLVIEDSALNSIVIEEYMTDTGYQLQFADNGRSGVEAFQTGAFDFVLMDLHMPKLDGITTTEVLRDWEHKEELVPTPIIAMTADSLTGTRERTKWAGFDGYMTKPFSREQLFAVLSRCVGKEVSVLMPSTMPVVNPLDSLLPRFFEQTARDIDLMSVAMRDDDPEAVAELAHTTKGHCRMFGFDELADMARNLELTVREMEAVTPLITELWKHLQQGYDRVAQARSDISHG